MSLMCIQEEEMTMACGVKGSLKAKIIRLINSGKECLGSTSQLLAM